MDHQLIPNLWHNIFVTKACLHHACISKTTRIENIFFKLFTKKKKIAPSTQEQIIRYGDFAFL